MSPDTSITVGNREIDPVRGGLLVLLASVALIGYGGFDYYQQQRAVADAEPVNATVLETGVEADSAGSNTNVDYYPVVRFEYTYDGETYTSNDVYPASLQQSFDTESGARDIVDEYEVDSTVTAYTVPSSPGDGFLRKQQSDGPFTAIGIGGVMLLLGGWSVLRGYRS